MFDANLLEGRFPLGIALSGGSDSTALLCLATDAFGPERLRAVTINHGLREGAREEAEKAGATCAALGIAHEIVTLNLAKGSDLQARARNARYGALSAWARENAISAIALGHTQDDVAETFLMRLSRGSGVDGLARMPARFEREGCTFLRPLLEARRSDLRDMLKARSLSWSDDPSNEDARFTRVQMRQAQAQLDALGLTPERLSQTAKWMRAASEVCEQAADSWIAQHARADHGDAVLDPIALREAPEETALRVLSRVLCNISGNPYRPRLSALSEAVQGASATTLHGCLIYPHKGQLRITRELSAATSQELRWTLFGPLKPEHHIAPLDETGLSQIENWRDTALLPRRSLLASPAVWLDQTVVAAPLARPDQIWSAQAENPLRAAKSI